MLECDTSDYVEVKRYVKIKITVLHNIGVTRFSATAIAICPTITPARYTADYRNLHGHCIEPLKKFHVD
jgi:hypothetical protein